LRCAALLASKAKGFKPTVDRTKTCSHCLGSCWFLPRHSNILHCNMNFSMH